MNIFSQKKQMNNHSLSKKIGVFCFDQKNRRPYISMNITFVQTKMHYYYYCNIKIFISYVPQHQKSYWIYD